MKVAALMLLALLLGNCAYYGVREPAVAVDPAVTEAQAARSQCRALAKNLVQIARCDGR